MSSSAVWLFRRIADTCLGIVIFLRLNTVAELMKLRIALLSTLSAATGYAVFSRTPDEGLVTASLGVLLLASGACVINQIQDRAIDARMERTCRRPIPAGKVTPAAAFVLAASLTIAGFALLWLVHNLEVALIGVLAVAWYNGVYACLKRVSAVAVVPGALVGALPPVIGWTAAGGSPLDPHVLALAFFFFVWQVPHFWLLLFVHRTDFEKAGLPSLTRTFGIRQFASLSFIWMLATSVSSLLLPIYLLTSSPWVSLGLAACGSWLAWEASKLPRGYRKGQPFLPAFRSINLYAVCVMALLLADALL